MDRQPPEPISMDKSSILASEPVKFTVGLPQTMLYVHSDLLRWYSKYHEELPNPLPAQDFPADKSDVFQELFSWPYREELSRSSLEFDETFIFELFVLAERLKFSGLQRDICTYLDRSDMVDARFFCDPKAIRYV